MVPTLARMRVSLLSEALELSELMSIFVGSNSLLSSSFIPSTSFAALSTQVLLAWANHQCQSQTRLLQFTRCVGRPCLIMAIARCLMLLGRLMTAIAFLGSAKLSVKRFCSLLASTMTFLFFINVIVIRLLWYVIPFSQSWPSEIKLKSHLQAKTTLCNSIVFSPNSGIETVPISFVCITCSAAVTKSIFLPFVFENSFRLLHR